MRKGRRSYASLVEENIFLRRLNGSLVVAIGIAYQFVDPPRGVRLPPRRAALREIHKTLMGFQRYLELTGEENLNDPLDTDREIS